MKKLFLLCLAAIAATSLTAQPAIRKMARNALQSAPTQFRFNNVKLVKSFTPSSNLSTTRNGVTRTVQPFNGATLGVFPQASPPQTTNTATTTCVTQTVALTAGFNELNLLDPSGIEFWPGRLINISSIDDGSYTSFNGFDSRNDLSVALIGAGTASSNVIRTVPNTGSGITQGTVTNAINTLKNNFGRNQFGSSSWFYESVEFTSTNQFLVEVGAGVQISPVNLETRASAGFNNREVKNKLVLRFVRDAFSVKVDNALDELVNAASLSDDAGVISSVKYGQFGIVEIESDSSISSMQAALDFKFNVDPSAAVSGSLATRLNAVASSMSIKAMFRGVAGNETIPGNPTIADLINVLRGEGSFSATTPVVPIAFTVNSVKTGEVMMLKTTLTFNKRECTVVPASDRFRLVIKPLAITTPRVNDGVSDDEDVFGNISMRLEKTPGSGNFQDVWSKGLSSHVKVKQSAMATDAGAYSMAGDADDYSFNAQAVGVDANDKLAVRVRLRDDEPVIGPIVYGERTLLVPVADLLRSVSADGTTSIDNFDNTNKAFFVEVTENNNTNKLRFWFKVKKEMIP